MCKTSSHTVLSYIFGSINLDEDNDKINSGKTLERPMGKKVENEKLKKRKTSDDVVQDFSPNWVKSRNKRGECMMRKRKVCALYQKNEES